LQAPPARMSAVVPLHTGGGGVVLVLVFVFVFVLIGFGSLGSEVCTSFFFESIVSVLSLRPLALSVTVRLPPLGTSRLSGPSNSLASFSQTSNALALLTTTITWTIATAGTSGTPASGAGGS